MSSKAILSPIQLGSLTLKNRVFMAPLTRCRATLTGHVPTPLMAEYYAQRASAGLIIAEATMVGPETSAFWTEPGVWNAEQVEGWKKVTEAVHAKEGKIALQIVHGGRAAHTAINEKPVIVAPSAIAIQPPQVLTASFNPENKPVPYVVPRELTDEEISTVIVGQFVNAAKNAFAAGFDAVEFHSANAYLLSSFLSNNANKRTSGPYSGTSIENRARLLFEAIDKSIEAGVDASRIGVRISPLNQHGDNRSSDASALTEYVATQAEKRRLAYLHVMRADFFGPVKENILEVARVALKKTVLVANMGYTPKEAEADVAAKKVDAVAFGTKFLANPDLPARIAADAKLTNPDSKTFYTHDAAGYTDYPFMA
jgi:N-ethylmaleimide reductase